VGTHAPPHPPSRYALPWGSTPNPAGGVPPPDPLPFGHGVWGLVRCPPKTDSYLLRCVASDRPHAITLQSRGI